MAVTFDLLASYTVPSGGVSNVEFTSISGTYKDLSLIINTRNTDIYNEIHYTFNNGTSYNVLFSQATGTTTSIQTYGSTKLEGVVQAVSGATTNVFGAANIHIQNYANSTFKKLTMATSTQANLGNFYVSWSSGDVLDTTSITSIKFTSSVGNLAEYSSIYLYGIK